MYRSLYLITRKSVIDIKSNKEKNGLTKIVEFGKTSSAKITEKKDGMLMFLQNPIALTRAFRFVMTSFYRLKLISYNYSDKDQ